MISNLDDVSVSRKFVYERPGAIEKVSSVICIIGMHRSGTSLVTGLLQQCGLNLGPPEHLLPPNADNPRGYFENNAFSYHINDELLAHLGGSWDQPPTFREDWEYDNSLSKIVSDAKLLLESFSQYSPWGWKDPRTALLLPFWKSLVPNLRYVVCVRNPLDVAKSLARRDRMPIAQGAALWLEYTKAAIQHTASQPRIIVSYEDLLQNAPATINALIDFCDLQRPERTTKLYSSISSELNNHRSSLYELLNEHSIAAECKLCYLGIRALMGGGYASPILDEESGPNNIDKFAGLFEQLNTGQRSTQKQLPLIDKEQENTCFDNPSCQDKQKLTENDRHLADLQDAIASKQQTTQQQELTIVSLTKERNQLKEALAMIDSSYSWQLISKLYGFEDKILPKETYRRRLYDLFWNAVKGLFSR